MSHKEVTPTVTRKLGANRGHTRLWLEGAVLTNAGFTHGARWDLIAREDGLTVAVSENGARKVAGTAARPIIDINSSKVLAVLGATGDVVNVVCAAAGLILLSKVAA